MTGKRWWSEQPQRRQVVGAQLAPRDGDAVGGARLEVGRGGHGLPATIAALVEIVVGGAGTAARTHLHSTVTVSAIGQFTPPRCFSAPKLRAAAQLRVKSHRHVGPPVDHRAHDRAQRVRRDDDLEEHRNARAAAARQGLHGGAGGRDPRGRAEEVAAEVNAAATRQLAQGDGSDDDDDDRRRRRRGAARVPRGADRRAQGGAGGPRRAGAGDEEHVGGGRGAGGGLGRRRAARRPEPRGAGGPRRPGAVRRARRRAARRGRALADVRCCQIAALDAIPPSQLGKLPGLFCYRDGALCHSLMGAEAVGAARSGPDLAHAGGIGRARARRRRRRRGLRPRVGRPRQ